MPVDLAGPLPSIEDEALEAVPSVERRTHDKVAADQVADVIVGVSVVAGAEAGGEHLASDASDRLSRGESVLKDTTIRIPRPCCARRCN